MSCAIISCLLKGRCARAGRKGHAFSLVGSNEICYLLDLYLFLNRPLTIIDQRVNTDTTEDDYLGRIPKTLIEEELAALTIWNQHSSDVVSQWFNVTDL